VNSAGGTSGISANNFGTGALRVTSTGTSTGTNTDGISAYNSANGTDLTVSAANSSGATKGIAASNYGKGALTVSSTGTATGTTQHGIWRTTRAAGQL
jgi:hypothetical protein